MDRKSIPINEFTVSPVHLWGEQWLLLTAGTNQPGKFNCMTVAWGSFGMMWAKPLAMVVVRPGRYTYEFMERSESFTLCAFPPDFKDKLTLCGTRSGRDLDKVQACGLTPIASSDIEAPGYDEATLIVECRKMYFADFHPSHFVDPSIAQNYSNRDYHRMYFGEIRAVHGIAAFRRKTR